MRLLDLVDELDIATVNTIGEMVSDFYKRIK